MAWNAPTSGTPPWLTTCAGSAARATQPDDCAPPGPWLRPKRISASCKPVSAPCCPTQPDMRGYSSATYSHSDNVALIWFLEGGVDLRCPVFRRQRTQTTSLEHQDCDNGAGNEDRGGPHECRCVAVEQSGLAIGRSERPTDQVGRGSTCGHRVEQHSADGSPHLLCRVECGRSHAGVLGRQAEGASAEGGGDAQSEPDS